MTAPALPATDTPLITAAELMALQAQDGPLVLLDCGFDLADPSAGERAFAAGHLPGAVYAHLDRDLAGPATGRNGRHPLPAREAFAARVGAWGITPATRVVVYDASGGIYAARAWWMLRWLGHTASALLDGGRPAWQAAGGALVATPAGHPPQPPYPASAQPAMPVIDAEALLGGLDRHTILDARSPERFRGEGETLDPVGGHIPGARNRFFKLNLQPDGRFKPAAELRAEFEALDLGTAPRVQQCGSGVTACHNLLAMLHAGLAPGALYAGSWSEWCADPARPVARG